ncbi:MAG: hypothetical protein IJ724_14510 [Muribaculaceae bacterium]|nr:hypothetical protein [Muribaculaceae bacterium]
MKKILLILAASGIALGAMAQANVTYSLTTHVDGRTLTASATLAADADLLESMPQALWRGFCDYKFYSDANLTEEITATPLEDATVYVDYTFDPPFQVSTDDNVVWNYLKGFTSSASRPSDDRYVYYSQYKQNIYNQNDLSTGSMTLKARTDAQWAFEGDAYSLAMRYNDVNNLTANDYMIPGSSTASGANVRLGAKPALGWQVHYNTASGRVLGSGFVSFVRPDNNHILTIEDVGAVACTRTLSYNSMTLDAQGRVVPSDSYYANRLFWSAFIATPVSNGSTSVDIWHVTYKIIMPYQNYEQRGDDIVETKPQGTTMMPELKEQYRLPGYTYSYYMDAELTEEWTEEMPADCNSVVYVKEMPEQQTAISDVKAENVTGDNAWYTIMGQRVSQPTQGLYIHQGKKVIVK